MKSTSTLLGRVYRDGEVICRQGELGNCMYVIQEGKVELVRRVAENEFCLALLEVGNFWGEAGLLEPGHVRTATARAVGDTCIISIEKRLFLARMHEDPSFVLKVMRKMSRRIQELETALVRISGPPSLDLAALRTAVAPAAGPQQK